MGEGMINAIKPSLKLRIKTQEDYTTQNLYHQGICTPKPKGMKMPSKNKDESGQPLVVTICSSCKTPKLSIKYSTLVKPFYYPNSPSIARYSITCLFDPEENKEFLKGILAIERNEKVESIIKIDTFKTKENETVKSGRYTIKFQTKDKVPVFIMGKDEKPVPIELTHEFTKADEVVVIYDILRYTKRNTIDGAHGLSFKPTTIYFYPGEK